MTALPLNDAQRLLRYWDEIQPYLAIDAIEALGPIDVDKLRTSAEDELAQLGVGFPVVSADGRTVSYRSDRPSVSVTETSGISTSALADQCSAELNRRFEPNVDSLIRMWIVRTLPHPYIGMTWQHWPIDGVSGSDLFRRILHRFIGQPLEPHQATATDLVATDLATSFAPWLTWKRKASYLRMTIAEGYRNSRIFVVPRPPPERTSLRVHMLELPPPPRPAGATINDVVAAALIAALAEALPERQRNYWRRRINLMSFVDLRAYDSERLRSAWGLFLTFCILHMPEPCPLEMRDLIRSIHDQSVGIQDTQAFFASLSATTTLRQHWPWYPRKWRWSIPYNLTPSTAALTNTRFRAEWSSGPLAEYFGRSWRVAPLGGLTPLIANVCTKGNQLSLALTCEQPSFMSERIEGIKGTMSKLLQ